MFVLGEIKIIGAKLVKDHVWVGNIRENIPKHHPRILEKGHKVGAKTVQSSVKQHGQSTARCQDESQ